MSDVRETRGELLRAVPDDARRTTRIGRFADAAEAVAGRSLPDDRALWRWSIEDPDRFWRLVAEQLGVRWHEPPDGYLVEARMPGARWCPGGTLNYAEHALAPHAELSGEAPALIARSQTRAEVSLTRDQLREQVARCAAGLRRLGVERGGRVAGYLPNGPEAVVALLATASLGATWASCPPEFGVRSVVDRLGQLAPEVLLTVDGYRYGRKDLDRRDEARQIAAGLPSLRHVVAVPYLYPSDAGDEDTPADGGPAAAATTTWAALLAEHEPLTFAAVPFEHPLYVLFSSGTTGLPKPIVHGHGGITLEHLKALALEQDLGPGDRFYWFSTTGWMMWNYLVSGLLVGATIVLYDGDPGFPDLGETWRVAAATGVTAFGTSAPFLLACRRAELVPRELADLSRLRFVGSTGAPLPPEGFRWVYDAVAGPGQDLLLNSISGGTDVCTAFVGGSPLLPVRAGEIGGAWLGCDVRAADAQGRAVIDETGELVVGTPMPSMPVGFLGDEDGSRFRAAYFERFDGLWCHGDWVTIHADGSLEVTGRSDATLNRGGVRLGTAEFYAVVEDLEGVDDSLVVHLEDPQGGAGELLLFLVPSGGIPREPAAAAALRDELAARCARALRGELSPRHVPDSLLLVPGVPRTLSGKKLEVPVKRILTGTPIAEAASTGSLADPAVLDVYLELARERGSAG